VVIYLGGGLQHFVSSGEQIQVTAGRSKAVFPLRT
jgi:hypothetical protein